MVCLQHIKYLHGKKIVTIKGILTKKTQQMKAKHKEI